MSPATPAPRLGKVTSEDLQPALLYAGLIWLLYSLELANFPALGLHAYAPWWPLPLALGCLAIFLRRVNIPLAATVIALCGMALLLAGSIGGFFLLFEAVFTLVLLGGPRISRAAEHGAAVLTGLLMMLMYFVTGSAPISVTFGLVTGMTLLLPAEWAGNIRNARNLADSEAKTAAALAEAAAAQTQAREAKHEILLAEESVSTALEIHGLLSARLTEIALQSGAALDSPDDAVLNTLALEKIRVLSLKGIEELNSMIRMMPRETSPAPAATLAGVPALIDTFTSTGLLVKYRNELPEAGSGLPTALQAALYRAANESLMNFSKHAPHGELDLCLALENGSVQFTASNPLRAGAEKENLGEPPPGATPGTGLLLIQARSGELGGFFRAGATGNLFTLKMLLPVDDR